MRPDFDDLVGADLEAGERARLERVHKLLIASGPPPELATRPVELRLRRRRGALLAIAAALAVSAVALGATLFAGSGGGSVDVVTMEGTALAANATAALTVFGKDEAGNWPMELRVQGLPPASSGRPFELWLTRDDKLGALCGDFLTTTDGSTVVPLNAPYRLDQFDGWVVVEEGSGAPLLTTT